MTLTPPTLTKVTRPSQGEWPDLSEVPTGFMWPGAMVVAASEAVASSLEQFARYVTGAECEAARSICPARIIFRWYLLGARDDELVAPDQLFATANRVGTPKQHIGMAIEPCGHLSLFLGAETIKRSWMRIAEWLSEAP